MAKYTKSYSNYVVKKKHTSTSDYDILERDFVTYNGKDILEDNGQTYSSGNFIVKTSNDISTYSNNINYGEFDNNPFDEEGFYVLSDVNKVEDEELSETLILKPDVKNLKQFSYYGSCSELIRSSIESIVKNFPASIYVSQYLDNDGYALINNPFNINLLVERISLSSDDNYLRYFCESYQDYEIFNPSFICDSGITESLSSSGLSRNCIIIHDNVNSESSGDTCNFEFIDGIICNNYSGHTGVNIGENFNIYFDFDNNGNILNYKTDWWNIGKHIRPKYSIINSFFNGLNTFLKTLLNKDTFPKYKSKFIVPIETEYGLQERLVEFLWKRVDGWNIDIESIKFKEFIDKLTNYSQVSDNYYSDNIYRMFTDENLKNLDTSYLKENNIDYTDSETVFSSIIRVYGAFFDQIKQRIESLSYINNINYNQLKNTPDILLKNKLNENGIIYNSIIKDWNKYELTNTIYGGQIKKYTPKEVEYEFLRRTNINVNNILKSKGTRNSIEEVMSLFAVPRDWYSINEYIFKLEGVKVPIEDESGNVTLSIQNRDYFTEDELNEIYFLYKIKDKFINNTGYYKGENDITNYSVRYSTDSLDVLKSIGIIMTEIQSESVSEIRGYLYQQKGGDNIYFQSKGGWFKETSNYVGEVPYYSDLYYLNSVDIKSTNIFKVTENNNYYIGNENNSGITWDLIDSGSTYLQNILSIVETNDGNNPHIGRGHYDNGVEYVNNYKQIFKSVIDNVPSCMETDNPNRYKKYYYYGFDIKKEIDNKKVWNNRNLNRIYNENISQSNDIVESYISDYTICDTQYENFIIAHATNNYLPSSGSVFCSGFTQEISDIYTTNENVLLYNKLYLKPNDYTDYSIKFSDILNVKNINFEITEFAPIEFYQELNDNILPIISQFIPSTSIFNIFSDKFDLICISCNSQEPISGSSFNIGCEKRDKIMYNNVLIFKVDTSKDIEIYFSENDWVRLIGVDEVNNIFEIECDGYPYDMQSGETRSVVMTVTGKNTQCSQKYIKELTLYQNDCADWVGVGDLYCSFTSIDSGYTTPINIGECIDYIEPVTDYFISVWDTRNTKTGSSLNNQVRLPLVSDGEYNMVVDWGDGTSSTITSYNQPEVIHTYSTVGEYTIKIDGTCKGWSFGDNNNASESEKITEIKRWGCLRFTDSGLLFFNCFNLILTNVEDIINFDSVTNLFAMFQTCSSLTTINHINEWDMSNIIITASMFLQCGSFDGNIGSWDVSNVTNMSAMFDSAVLFNNGGSDSINNWDVSNVFNMNDMFNNSISFNQPINDWNILNVIYFSNFMYNKTFNDYSVENYDKLLKSWAELAIQSDVQHNININFGDIKHSNVGKVGKDILMELPYLWNFSDGGNII